MRHGLLSWLAQAKDRLLASDPGLGRLRTALSATSAMGAALLVEYLFALATGVTGPARLMAMLIGAVVAMMGAMALTDTSVWRKVRVASLFPVAIGLGLVAGAAVGRHRDLMLVGFVLAMFLAVFVRRFGLPFFFYGFMLWMGYFFASFLQLTLAHVPALVVAVLVGSATVLVLSSTVMRTNPRKVLRATWHAYTARGRAVARACASLLDPGTVDDRTRERRLRRLAARQAGVAEAALMMEGWSEERGALAPGWSGAALRRHTLDVQQTLDRMATSSAALAADDPVLVAAACEVADRLARDDQPAARAAAGRLDALADDDRFETTAGGRHARQLAVAAREYLDLVRRDPEPPQTGDDDGEFAAAAPLMMGNLPGSPSVAREVSARGARWNLLARLDMTTRQAVQASLAGALAIVLGVAVSPARYYWAVIAAFVVFTGTASRTETFLKAVNRVLGTVVGLVAAIWLARLTHGETLWVLVVILASMFLGFYLMRISYAYMIFFVTIMLGQLYSLLHQFSSGLLVLRLEETAVGAAVGVVVALVITPLSTRDTARSARDNLLTALAELLEGVAGWVEREDPRPDLDALARTLDNRVRQLNLVAKPLTRPLVWGNHSPRTRHRLQLYSVTAEHARALVSGLRRSPAVDSQRVAEVCRFLADAATCLVEVLPGDPAPLLDGPLAAAEDALFREWAGAAPAEPVLRPLLHLHRTLGDLAVISPVVEASASRAAESAS